MGFLRRDDDETLNEQLLREAGLDEAGLDEDDQVEADPEAAAAEPEGEAPVEVETTAIRIRPDAVVPVEAPAVAADAVGFVALPDGDLVADDDETADEDLSAFADAVEERLQPPYRVHGRRSDGDLWELLVYRLEVRRFDFDGADTLRLACRDGETELLADGEPVDASIAELEDAGRAVGDDYAVQAERLDGDLWEVRAAAL